MYNIQLWENFPGLWVGDDLTTVSSGQQERNLYLSRTYINGSLSLLSGASPWCAVCDSTTSSSTNTTKMFGGTITSFNTNYTVSSIAHNLIIGIYTYSNNTFQLVHYLSGANTYAGEGTTVTRTKWATASLVSGGNLVPGEYWLAIAGFCFQNSFSTTTNGEISFTRHQNKTGAPMHFFNQQMASHNIGSAVNKKSSSLFGEYSTATLSQSFTLSTSNNAQYDITSLPYIVLSA